MGNPLVYSKNSLVLPALHYGPYEPPPPRISFASSKEQVVMKVIDDSFEILHLLFSNLFNILKAMHFLIFFVFFCGLRNEHVDLCHTLKME